MRSCDSLAQRSSSDMVVFAAAGFLPFSPVESVMSKGDEEIGKALRRLRGISLESITIGVSDELWFAQMLLMVDCVGAGKLA